MIPLKNNGIEYITDFLIFDTNIFLTGIDINLIKGILFTTPKIIEEIKVKKFFDKNRIILTRIQAAIDSKKLYIRSPSAKYIQIVNENARFTGDYNALSDADKELIALALEFKHNKRKNVIIYTDDYSMENVCSELKVSYSSLNKNGINKKIIWEVYCPFCEDSHKPEDLNKSCEKCGSKLKRKPKKNNN